MKKGKRKKEKGKRKKIKTYYMTCHLAFKSQCMDVMWAKKVMSSNKLQKVIKVRGKDEPLINLLVQGLIFYNFKYKD